MFCPSCGFEYTQKTNYCKRCGEGLSITNNIEPPKSSRPRLGLMYFAVAAFGIAGLGMLIAMYDTLVLRGLRGDELIIPFAMGLCFIGGIAGLLIWQLARLITAYKEMGRNVVVETRYIREAPPAQFAAPPDQIQQTIEPSSVVEHTTRQFAGKYKG